MAYLLTLWWVWSMAETAMTEPNRWERLRDMPPAEEALLHYESSDDPLDASDLICDGCKDDWPCDFERGRRAHFASRVRYRWTPTGMSIDWDFVGLDPRRWIEVLR